MANIGIKRPSFFLVIAIVGLAAVIIGFAKTFFIPVGAGTFTAPPAIYLHGSFAFAWILLYLVQTSLIHYRKYGIHQVLGILGVFIAVGLMITMVPVGLYVVHRELARGLGQTAYSTLLGTIISGVMYFALVVAGILTRNRPESHKRLMLLATIVVLWPAWFRFRHYFPSVPRPDIWFALVLADSLIVISWIWDKARNGGIHPVLKYAGSLIILEQTFEVIAFDTPAWRVAAKWMYALLEQIA